MKKALQTAGLCIGTLAMLEAIERVSRPFAMGLALGLLIGLCVAIALPHRQERPLPHMKGKL